MRWWFGLIIPCCFTFIGATEAADCPGTDLRFTSDDEVKAYFSSDSAQGCDVITGDITFSGPAITDVFWFRYFYRVEGRLTIDSTSVPDFRHCGQFKAGLFPVSNHLSPSGGARQPSGLRPATIRPGRVQD